MFLDILFLCSIIRDCSSLKFFLSNYLLIINHCCPSDKETQLATVTFSQLLRLPVYFFFFLQKFNINNNVDSNRLILTLRLTSSPPWSALLSGYSHIRLPKVTPEPLLLLRPQKVYNFLPQTANNAKRSRLYD